MALIQRGVVLLFMVVIATLHVSISYAAVHKVGDSAGWTILGNVDYNKWATPKKFQVGDTILFEYNAQFHNVLRVTHAMYKTCNASSPIATFTTGKDSIKITNPGHHFFLCGVPGHCQAGQKVDINVVKVSAAAAATAPASAPSSSSSSSPSPSSSLASPSANVAAPSPNNAAPLIVLKGLFGTMGLAMAVLALSL